MCSKYMINDVNPFDMLSGKVVQNERGIFYFKEAGDNMHGNSGWPIFENLHRENNLPAALWADGEVWWYVDGKKHRTDGPAIRYGNGNMGYYINGVECSSKDLE